jgi:transmembrane sensor
VQSNTSKTLLAKYINDECSQDELKSVFEVLKTDEGLRLLKTLMDEHDFIERPISDKEIHSLDTIYSTLKSHIHEKPKQRDYAKPFLKIAASISLLAILTIGLYTQRDFLINIVDPLPYTAQSATNQPYELRLSDNSIIWLNVNSTLRFPEQFRSSGSREVYLEGEAFFEITPDATRPFIIHSKGTTTKVLGTSFNLRAYRNEHQHELTVFTGKVQFSDSVKSTNSIIVAAHQRVVFSDVDQTFKKETSLSPENYIAWRDQKIIFDQTPLNEVAKILSRTYHVEIQIEESLQSYDINARFNKEPLEKILDLICITIQTRYRKEGDVFIIGETDKK